MLRGDEAALVFLMRSSCRVCMHSAVTFVFCTDCILFLPPESVPPIRSPLPALILRLLYQPADLITVYMNDGEL